MHKEILFMFVVTRFAKAFLMNVNVDKFEKVADCFSTR